MEQTQPNCFTNNAFNTIEEGDVKETKPIEKCKTEDCSRLLYQIQDTPPWHLSILLGFQHYLTMVGSTIALPLILGPALCIGKDDPTLGILVSTIIFVSGIVTLLQVTVGVRLPIIQGGTFAFLIPTFAILKTFGSCEVDSDISDIERREMWLIRVREVQGAIIVASFFQILISITGVLGWLLTWITPLSVVPTITLIGLALSEPAAHNASGCWPIAIMTSFIIMIFSQFLHKTKVKFPVYDRQKGILFKECALFGLFPILLGIILSWGITGILTVTDVLPANSTARTDIKMNMIHEAPWIYVPYPFQFGLPTVSLSAVFGMLAGVLASMIESIGDYYACARICGAPPPPVHAINRGIGIEGLGCVIAGIWGTCNGTTSYSENIGAIRITGVGSRRVVQIGAGLMMIFGMFGKFGATCASIPEPVLAGVFMIVFSMIIAVGLSNLQLIDLNSSRNLFVLGTSIFIGIMFPNWLSKNTDAINTGSDNFDQILVTLLSSSMLIGGLLGIFLDNTIPGTPEERGLHNWNNKTESTDKSDKNDNTYDLPFGMDFIKKHAIFRRIPICPTFRGFSWKKNDITINS